MNTCVPFPSMCSVFPSILIIVCLKVDETMRFVEITLGEPYINIKGIGNILFEALIPYLNKIKVRYAKQEFQIIINKGPDVLADLEGILYKLISVKKTNRTQEIA